jgi:two-component system, NarL family, sensor histidine kinase UhpB
MVKTLKRNENIQVWIVEDNAGDLLLLQEILIDLNFKAKNIHSFETLTAFSAALTDGYPDVILLDLFLPGTQGIETFASVKDIIDRCPVIILSGLDNMETALESVKMGAQDYLIKDEITDEMINKMINYAIERFANINEIKRSEEKYKLLFRSIPQPVIMLDQDLKILELNDAAFQVLNVCGDKKGMPYASLFPTNLSGELAIQSIEEKKHKLIKLNFPDGSVKYLEQSPKQGNKELRNRWLITLADRTEIIENEINRNKIVHETLDEERNRFARELHDGLAQYLVSISLHLQMLNGLSEEADATVQSCSSILDTSIKLARSLSYNLSPPDIEKGLIAALESFFRRMQNVNNVKFTLEVDEKLKQGDRTEEFDEYQLFRMIQEFINNSLKYSECSEIKCKIAEVKNILNIQLEDNGKGFDISSVQKGLGLSNMKQRAGASGFKFSLDSLPGHGTRMELTSELTIT